MNEQGARARRVKLFLCVIMFTIKLLYVHLCNLNEYVFIRTFFISAHPHLNVISGGLWQLLVEPWRIVKGAACIGTSAISVKAKLRSSHSLTILCLTHFNFSLTFMYLEVSNEILGKVAILLSSPF